MKVLLDSDFLFGLFIENDVHHKKARSIAQKYKNKKASFFALNLVIQETATVISKKKDQGSAKMFYKNFDSVIDKIIILDSELENKAWDVFLKQTKKKTSFIDCANLAVQKEYKLAKIASFDKFYPKELVLK